MKFFDLQFNGLGAKALYFDDKNTIGNCTRETYTNGRNLDECYYDAKPGAFVQYVQNLSGCKDTTYRSAKNCLRYGFGD